MTASSSEGCHSFQSPATTTNQEVARCSPAPATTKTDSTPPWASGTVTGFRRALSPARTTRSISVSPIGSAEAATRPVEVSTRTGRPRLGRGAGDQLVEQLTAVHLGEQLPLACEAGGQAGDAVSRERVREVRRDRGERDVGGDGEQRDSVGAARGDHVVGHEAVEPLSGQQRDRARGGDRRDEGLAVLGVRRQTSPVSTSWSRAR